MLCTLYPSGRHHTNTVPSLDHGSKNRDSSHDRLEDGGEEHVVALLDRASPLDTEKQQRKLQ